MDSLLINPFMSRTNPLPTDVNQFKFIDINDPILKKAIPTLDGAFKVLTPEEVLHTDIKGNIISTEIKK